MQRAVHIKPGKPSPQPADMQRLYDEHAEFIRILLHRLLGPWGDADDITQDVFVLAWRKLAEFRDDNPRPWLYGMAIKRASEVRRRSWLKRFLQLEAAGELIDWRTPEDSVERGEARALVYSALEKLSERTRTAFILFELQGMSGQEIADLLGCPLQTVWSRIYAARRKLVRLLGPAAQRWQGRRP